MSSYHKRVTITIDHVTGNARIKSVVLGGHIETAESSASKNHAGRMTELFRHQKQEPTADSLRFLRRGAE